MQKNKIKNEYNNVKKPDELLNFMNNYIHYGFIGNKTQKLHLWDDVDFQESCLTDWGLTSPDKLLNNQYGHCWDQVELERDWFKKNNYEFKTIFIWFLIDIANPFPTHAFLIYRDGEKWCWFEHSDILNRGIHMYNTFEEAIVDQRKTHIVNTKNHIEIKEEDVSKIHIFEYEKPSYGCSYDKYLDNIINNAKDITNEIML